MRPPHPPPEPPLSSLFDFLIACQVLGKSCKPIPVMFMGAFLGKKYPLKKYLNVALIVAGVALFMQSGSGAGKPGGEGGGQVRDHRTTIVGVGLDGSELGLGSGFYSCFKI